MKKKVIIGIILVSIFSFILYQFGSSLAMIENDSRVAENSELTYYIDVIYDGKDSEIITSSDTAVASVYSDYIYVEDKIPEGLTFKNFLTAGDGTVGAVKRSDGTSCPGYVVGNSDGLVYDNVTNTVSFKIKSLQAGCKLTVGVVTQTPMLNGEVRKDFYNTASARENDFSVFSNTVHVYMGRDDVTLYSVTYRYTGDVPDNAPSLPNSSNYGSGTSVGVENDVTLAGYSFSGWTTEDVSVTNGSFTMPSSNVTFTGSFTSKTNNQVSYTINGGMPDGYVPPVTRSYGVGDDVVVDQLSEGDIINGYRFLGWTSTGVDLSDGIFVMPNENVQLVGTFEEVTYKVTYAFQGSDIPSNADELLPEVKSYKEGDRVTLASYPIAPGYEFIGWYHEDKFEMPGEDVVIYGEWKVISGTFSPTIKKEIIDKKDSYHEGDIVSFKVTVTNTADFEITDVMVQDHLDGVTFLEGDGYTVRSSRFVVIPRIVAGGSVVIDASYVASGDVVKAYSNTVEITGALASNHYYLDTSHEYVSQVEFNVSNINLNVKKTNVLGRELTGAVYTLYSDADATNEVASGLEYQLDVNKTYYLKETRAPVGYQLSNEVVPIQVSSDGVVSSSLRDVSGSDGKYTITFVDNEINILPNTGGIGSYVYLVGGLVIVVISGVLLYLFYRNRKGKSDEK